MGKQVAEALAALRNVGTPDEMRNLAAEGYTPSSPLLVNAHIHLPPNFSAFETVPEALDLATAQQIGVLGVSNYYDYQVYGDFAQRSRAKGIFPLFGLEVIAMQDELRDAGVKVNDPGNPGKTYICGKGITHFDHMSDESIRLLDVIRRNDRRRMIAMVDRLRKIFRQRGLDTDVDEEAVIDMVVRRHQSPRETVYLQERHASQAFQEALFDAVRPVERIDKVNAILGAQSNAKEPTDAVAIQNDIRAHLMKSGKPAFVEEAYLSFEEAQQLILELGGVPSYPTLADGASPVCEYEESPDALIRSLQNRGIHAVEWIPPRNSVATLRDYVTKMRGAGLIVTAGTEHNTLEQIPLNPACKDGEVPADVRPIFWEGACVLAAHQFLTLHGECGYVDRAGTPNAAYASADDRITDLARVGAAVVRHYCETCKAE